MDDFNRIWEDFGCNLHDVIVLEICTRSSQDDAQIDAWGEKYNVQYTAISGEGGGPGVTSDYGTGYTPAAALIEPDKTYSNPEINSLYQKIENLGVEKNDCATDIENYAHIKAGNAPFVISQVNSQKISIAVPHEGQYTIKMFSADGKLKRTISSISLSKGSHSITWDGESLAKGIFFIELNQGKQKVRKRAIIF